MAGQQVNGYRNLDVTRARTSTRRRTSTQSEKSKMADIAIVGGGPSGAMCGAELARAGHTVNIFDQHLAWEKPCGGGLTHKAIQNFPFLLDNPYPKKLVQLHRSDQQRRSSRDARHDASDRHLFAHRTERNAAHRAAEAGCKVHRSHVFSVDTASDRSQDFASKASGERRIFWCLRAVHGISLCPRRGHYNAMNSK